MPISLDLYTASDYALEAKLQTLLQTIPPPTSPTDLAVYKHAKALLGLELPGTVIVVTGTNGKGSTVKCLESIYLQAGYRVAATTSPHLSNFCERLTLNGRVIDSQWVLDALSSILALDIAGMSYAGIIYLALCLCIQRFQPEICILEVGIGGRLDPNNIFDTGVAVMTSVGLDHASLLGPSREVIGWDKAHIARSGKPFVCGEPDRPVIIDQVVNEIGGNLLCINNQFKVDLHVDSWSWHNDGKAYTNLPIPRIHLNNAACAIQVVECLQDRHPVSEADLRAGLDDTCVPGRYEKCVIKGREVIFDVAHNAQAMGWLATQLSDDVCAGQTWCVLGMKQEKQVDQALSQLCVTVNNWVATRINHPDSVDPKEIAAKLATLGEKNCYTYSSLDDALQLVFEQSQPADRILICGSFFLVGEAQAKLRSRADE